MKLAKMGSAIRDPSPPDDRWMLRSSPPTQAPATSFGVTPTNHASEFFCEVPVLPPMSAFSPKARMRPAVPAFTTRLSIPSIV